MTVQPGGLSHSLHLKSKSVSKPLIGGTTFHFIFLGATFWFVTGAYLDSWAHNNVVQLESFFTPWHGVLYSGILVIAILLSVTIAINSRRGATWLKAIPRGYELSTFFIFATFFAGVGDGVWHTLLGLERNVDGLMSPTHIASMVFMCIVILGPYRALYQRKEDLSKAEQLVLTLTVTFFLAILTIFSQETSVLWRLWPLTVPNSDSDGQLLAVVSFIFQGTLLAGTVLITLRRWQLPFGFFTCVLTVIAIGMSFMRSLFLTDILTSVIAGLLLDVAYRWLRPNLQRTLRLRLFAAITSCTIPAAYLLVVAIVVRPWVWTVHLSIGSVVVCAIFGWLLSYVAVPPTLPDELQEQP